MYDELFAFLRAEKSFRLDESWKFFDLTLLILERNKHQNEFTRNQEIKLFSTLLASKNLTCLKIHLHDLNHLRPEIIAEFLWKTRYVKKLLLSAADDILSEKIQMLSNGIKKNRSIEIISTVAPSRINCEILAPVFAAIAENTTIRKFLQKIDLKGSYVEEFKYWNDMLSNRSPCQLQSLEIGSYRPGHPNLQNMFRLLCQELEHNNSLHTLTIRLNDNNFEVIISLLNIILSSSVFEKNFSIHHIYFAQFPPIKEISFLQSFENFQLVSQKLERNFTRCLKKKAIELYLYLKMMSYYYDFPYDILRYIFDFIIDLQLRERKELHGVYINDKE